MKTRDNLGVLENEYQNALDALRRAMNDAHAQGDSWREVAGRWRISKALAYRIAHGDFTPRTPALCAKLEIPTPTVPVIPVMGIVPAGAQVFMARRCKCGKWFCVNHPLRRRCYDCSPPRWSENSAQEGESHDRGS